MKIYQPLGRDGFELCHPVDPGHFALINEAINGVPRVGSWKPPQMEMVLIDGIKYLKPSDSPWLGSNALIFRPSAAEIVDRIPGLKAEFIEFRCSAGSLYFFNPIAVPALDEEASDISRFDDGRIMGIWKHVFFKGVIKDLPAFKLSNLSVSPTFVSQEFVSAWVSARLRGLEFTPK